MARPFNYTIPFAFDKSVRSYTDDGHLKVEITNISKANICPYVGKEIPEWKALGLDPDKIYKLYRDADELKKAAPTFNQLPLLSEHQPVTAAAFPQELVIGSTGTDAVFEPPYLKNSLVVWTRDDIDDIEAAAKKELSSGYRYRADMTPGTLNGEKYDGVMRDIVGNHVALVREGRAGKDVVVGDSVNPTLTQALEGADTMKKATRTGTIAAMCVKTFIEPRMALDTTLDLDMFNGVTRRNFKTKKPVIMDSLEKGLKGKLVKRFALDDTLTALDSLMDMIGSGNKGAGDDEEELPGEVEDSLEDIEELDDEKGAGDDDPMAGVESFLRDKGMGDDDIEHCMGMLRGGGDTLEPERELGEGGGEDDNEPPMEVEENEEAGAASNPGQGGGNDRRRGARDRRMGRDEPPPFKGRPTVGGGMDSKQVVAFARQAADKAVVAERENQRAIRAAEQFVQPWVGNLSVDMGFDSAEAVYGTALESLGVDIDGVHPSAYQAVLKAQPLPGSKQQQARTRGGHALDSATGGSGSYYDRNPEAKRIKVM